MEDERFVACLPRDGEVRTSSIASSDAGLLDSGSLCEGNVQPSVLQDDHDSSSSSASSSSTKGEEDEGLESDGEVYLPAAGPSQDEHINDETSSDSSTCDIIMRPVSMPPPPPPGTMPREMLDAVLAGNTGHVRFLLQTGANPNATYCEALFDPVRVCYGDAVIHVACRLGYADILETLLFFGADVDQVSGTGKRAVHFASVRGHVECVKVLLHYGSDVDLREDPLTTAGDTPLIKAVASYMANYYKADDYLAVAKLLLEAGACVNVTDCTGLAPLHMAVTKGDTRMTQVLLQHSADVESCSYQVMTPLTRAIQYGSSEDNIRLLREKGCDMNRAGPGSFSLDTPLYLAVVRNDLGIILDLLEANANPNVGGACHSPLKYVASHRHLVTLLLLLAFGGDVNARSDIDRGTLLLALTRAHSVIGVEMMLRLGANPDLDNRLGTTPLWAAVKIHNFDIVKVLVQVNTDLNCHSLEFFTYRPITPIQLALELGDWEIAAILLDAGCTFKRVWLNGSNMPRKVGVNPAKLEWLHTWLHEPRLLKHLCRRSIRTMSNFRLAPLVQLLRYPQALKDYILVKDR